MAGRSALCGFLSSLHQVSWGQDTNTPHAALPYVRPIPQKRRSRACSPASTVDISGRVRYVWCLWISIHTLPWDEHRSLYIRSLRSLSTNSDGTHRVPIDLPHRASQSRADANSLYEVPGGLGYQHIYSLGTHQSLAHISYTLDHTNCTFLFNHQIYKQTKDHYIPAT